MPTPLSGACPACHSSHVRPAFRVSGSAFLRCHECRTLFDAKPYSKERMAEIYDGRQYFVKDDDGGAAEDPNGYSNDYLADRAFIEAKFDRVLGHLERYVAPGRLLDVGAGPGFLLTVAERRGWEAVGIDLNPWAAEHARSELGVDVRVGELTDGLFEEGAFDAVTMMDMIEHVPDPASTLAQVARLVRPGGAVAVLTPDAGAPVSRLLGRRWPEVQMPGEHPVLFSRQGLTATLARNGLVATSWHSIGKTTQVSTLLADVAPAAPKLSARVRDAVVDRPLGRRVVELDPHTKLCLYARRTASDAVSQTHQPSRVPKQPADLARIDAAIFDELRNVAAADRYCDWLFGTFAAQVPDARVLEVGAGVGTFSQRMLDAGACELVLLEPEPACADALEQRFASAPRVQLLREAIPGAPSLEGVEDRFDLVVCQNVLEHIAADDRAVLEMARVLRPGGRLAVLVPARPELFGVLDDAYGHWRRYTEDDVRALVTGAGLEIDELHPMNALGIPAWWATNRRAGSQIGARAVRAYDAVLALWRPIEERVRPRLGLSIVCSARKPLSSGK